MPNAKTITVRLSSGEVEQLNDLLRAISKTAHHYGLPIPNQSDAIRTLIARAWSDQKELDNGSIPARFKQPKPKESE